MRQLTCHEFCTSCSSWPIMPAGTAVGVDHTRSMASLFLNTSANLGLAADVQDVLMRSSKGSTDFRAYLVRVSDRLRPIHLMRTFAMVHSHGMALAAAAAAIAVGIATPASAHDRAHKSSRDTSRPAGSHVITACSTYGHHGCETAVVRYTKLGPQYRRPGGSWTWCETDCRDTLRRHTVDFWDTQTESSGR